jgi:hypothetical protein
MILPETNFTGYKIGSKVANTMDKYMNNNEMNLSNSNPNNLSNNNNLLYHKYGKNSSALSGHNSTRSNKNNVYDNDNIEPNVPIMEQRPNI